MDLVMPVLALILFLSSGAFAQVLNQDAHNRVLFSESWRGSYLRSTTVRSLGYVRFDGCGRSAENQCRAITGNFPLEKIDSVEAPLLARLESLRDQLKKDADSGMMSYLSGGSAKNGDVQGLNELIGQIRRDRLRNWILLTEQNISRDPPMVTSPEVSEKIYAIFSEEFAERTAPELRASAGTGPADSRTCRTDSFGKFSKEMRAVLGSEIQKGK